MDAIVQNMFEINYSQLIQYEILEKLVTFIKLLCMLVYCHKLTKKTRFKYFFLFAKNSIFFALKNYFCVRS